MTTTEINKAISDFARGEAAYFADETDDYFYESEGFRNGFREGWMKDYADHYRRSYGNRGPAMAFEAYIDEFVGEV